MITNIEAILLGIIQGITEWLPVSSSGHLVIIQQLSGIAADIEFDALLHFGTLLVVIAYFRSDLKSIIVDLIKASKSLRKTGKIKHTKNIKLAYLIALASIPTGIIGVFFKDVFEAMFTDLFIASLGLIVTGLFLLASKTPKEPSRLDWGAALIIGLAQGVAIVPGISRSGATIATALFLGVDRKEAARFSFLILIPAAVGGIILEGGGVITDTLQNTIPHLAGLATSIIVGYASLAYLMKIVREGKFHYFAYYVIPLGIASLIVSQLM
ncbi:MAG: undecaprenyl-diphosphate phosphatase [Methanobacteriota archaeon]